jgi:nitroimidazol reductase NimA-like FMN-containing flavoprotein (pyridoxamine 5'-phosphate oxidase superfamily)
MNPNATRREECMSPTPAKPRRRKSSRPSSTSQLTAPTFRELSRDECDALLARNHVGRVAFAYHDRVDIEPVHYVYAQGWLHGRTAPGAKLAILQHNPWIAFEVDEIEGLFDWRSIVVHGSVHIPDPEGSPTDRDAHAATLAQLRRFVPDTFTKSDPAPHRLLLFRIHVDDVKGRAAESGAPAAKRRPRKR